MKYRRAVVVGSTTIDKIIISKKSCLKLGGTTTYSGLTYQKHNVQTFIITNVAEKDKENLKKLSANGIKVLNGKTDITTFFVNKINGDKVRQELHTTANTISSIQIANALKPGCILHLGPLFPNDIEIKDIKSLDLENILVCLDLQGLLRGLKGKKVYPEISKGFTEALKIAHVVKANEKELELILKKHEKNFTKLIDDSDIKEFIVTFGSMGGFIKSRNGEIFTYNAFIPNKLADTTGAGDVFFAAYIIKRFVCLTKVEEAAQYASSVAARHVSGEFILPDKLIIAP